MGPGKAQLPMTRRQFCKVKGGAGKTRNLCKITELVSSPSWSHTGFPALSAARILRSQPSGSGSGMVPKSRASLIAITGHERPFVILCVYTAASLLAPECWKLHT